MPLLRNPESGEVRIVDNPAGLLSEGWLPASEEQAQQYAETVDLGGFGEQAQAFGERVVRGATLGAVTGFGTEEENRARADVQEREHPALAFAGDVVPAVAAGALAATGVGAIAEGAGLGALGVGTAALAGESAAGGLVGAGQAAYERGQYLGEDPGRDAENALIFGGLNFGLGAVGKILSKGGKSASRFATSAEEETAERASLADITKAAETRAASEGAPLATDATGELLEPTIPKGGESAVSREADRAAVEDGMDRALNRASKSEADDLLEEAAGTRVPVQEADSFGRQRALYQNRERILDVSVREMQQDLTSLMDELPELTRGGKLEDVARNVGDNLASQRAVSDGIAENAAEFAGQLRGEAQVYAAQSGKRGMQYQVPGTKGLVQALSEHAQALAEAKTGREMFEAANAFKQVLQDSKLSMENGAANSLDPIAHQKLIPRVGALASKVRAALEDPQVWGKAGDMQKAYNAVIHDQLIPSMRVFEESVLKRTSQGYDAIWKTEGWESKIESLLKGNDLGKARHVGSVLDGLDQLASLRSGFGDDAAGKSMADKVAKIRRTIGLAEEVQDATGRMQDLGRVVGSVPLVGGMAKEFVTGDLANAFRRLTNAVDRDIDRGVDDWIASSRVRGSSGTLLGDLSRTASRIAFGDGDSPIAQTARRLGISHGMAEFMGDDSSPTAAFERARAALQNDEQFFQSMGQDYKSLQEQSPETYLLLSGNAAKLRQFLIQRMPANVSPSMMRPEGYPPGRDAIEDWAALWNAGRNPRQVIRNIRSASLAELQTLQAGYPRLYERTQQRVIQKISLAQSTGEPLDDALLFRLNTLFPDVEGAGSPAFRRSVGQMARDYNAALQQTAPQPPKAPKPPQLAAGLGQTTAQTGATFGTGM